MTEEKFRNYIKEGDDFMNGNNYSLAIDKYSQALNLKKNDLIQAKYNSANEKYNQWKKENEYFKCAWCNKKIYKNSNGNYYPYFSLPEVTGSRGCYHSTGQSETPYSLDSNQGPFCSSDCCVKSYKNWKQEQWQKYGKRYN